MLSYVPSQVSQLTRRYTRPVATLGTIEGAVSY